VIDGTMRCAARVSRADPVRMALALQRVPIRKNDAHLQRCGKCLISMSKRIDS
jgi:hypothetical protein